MGVRLVVGHSRTAGVGEVVGHGLVLVGEGK